MQHIVPYTPQQNGVVERKNCTLKEMANCMIQSKGLSLKYWVEAIKCTNYIVNRTLTKALKNITQEEAWTKIKPDLSHFRVFGSIVWTHIPDERKNHTLKEMTNCMIQSKGLSPKYWVEAINCENYIVNHTPTKDLKNITPED